MSADLPVRNPIAPPQSGDDPPGSAGVPDVEDADADRRRRVQRRLIIAQLVVAALVVMAILVVVIASVVGIGVFAHRSL